MFICTWMEFDTRLSLWEHKRIKTRERNCWRLYFLGLPLLDTFQVRDMILVTRTVGRGVLLPDQIFLQAWANWRRKEKIIQSSIFFFFLNIIVLHRHIFFLLSVKLFQFHHETVSWYLIHDFEFRELSFS